MRINRKDFLKQGAGAALALYGTGGSVLSCRPKSRGIRAVAFDAFPILDPRPIFGLVQRLYPRQGKRFSLLWRTRIFEYTWLRVSGARYRDFWGCIEDALVFTARDLKVKLDEETKTRLMNAFLSLKAWPDAPGILRELKKRDIKLAFLSNMTEKMLLSGIKNSGLEGVFDHVISTDRVKTFKPDPRAYQLGIDAFDLPRENIAFTAFAGWDAAGAGWFGYPTVWVNRLNFSPEELGAKPRAVGRDLSVLTKFVREENA